MLDRIIVVRDNGEDIDVVSSSNSIDEALPFCNRPNCRIYKLVGIDEIITARAEADIEAKGGDVDDIPASMRFVDNLDGYDSAWDSNHFS